MRVEIHDNVIINVYFTKICKKSVADGGTDRQTEIDIQRDRQTDRQTH